MKSSTAIGALWFIMIIVIFGGLLLRVLHWQSPWIILWAIVLVVVRGIQMFIQSREQKREWEVLADWHRRLEAIVDIHDFEDDGHMDEFFEPAQREQLIQELERMPHGSRSLRRAIEIVMPELIDDDP